MLPLTTDEPRGIRLIRFITAILMMMAAWEQLKMMKRMNQGSISAEAKFWYDLTRFLNRLAYWIGKAAIYSENKHRSYTP